MQKKTFESLLKKTVAGKVPDRKKFFRTQLIFSLLRDPFWVWCEYHAPQKEAVPEEPKFDRFLKDWAQDHRKQYVREKYPDAVWIPPAFGLANYKATLKAMFDGALAIRSPHLWALGKNMYGQGDLIIRDDSHPSFFGNYHYRSVEIKRAKWLKKNFKIHGAAMTRLLGEIQGYTPEQFKIVLLNGETEVSMAAVQPDLDEVIKKWKAIRDGKLKPAPFLLDYTRSPWGFLANRIIQEKHDLTLLPEIDPNLREKIIEELKFDSLVGLKKLTLKKLKKTLGDKLGFAIFHSTLAYFAKKPILPDGVFFKIPRATRHYYFDFELSDEMRMEEPAHVYLIGIWIGEEERYIPFKGRGVKDEEKVFAEFLDFVGDPSDCRLYHWSDFEIRHMKKMAEKYPSLSERIQKIILSCTDLMKFIRSHIFIPVPSYSIKNVAPYLGFNWRQKDIGGFETMALYLDFLENYNSEAFEKIVTYNEDDCKAMWFIDKVLTSMFPKVELPSPPSV